MSKRPNELGARISEMTVLGPCVIHPAGLAELTAHGTWVMHYDGEHHELQVWGNPHVRIDPTPTRRLENEDRVRLSLLLRSKPVAEETVELLATRCEMTERPYANGQVREWVRIN